MKRRSFELLVSVAVVAVSVVLTFLSGPSTPATALGAGLVVGVLAAVCLIAYGRLAPRLGYVTTTLVIALALGAVLFVTAEALPHCPGTTTPARCTTGEAAGFLGIGLLFPVLILLIIGPSAGVIAWYSRLDSDEKRHPLRTLRRRSMARLRRLMRRPSTSAAVPARVEHHGRVTVRPRSRRAGRH